MQLHNDEYQTAIADRDWWRSWERNGWKCCGFTGRHVATFFKGRASVEISYGTLECLGLVDPEGTGDNDA